ncbi:TusE/DsrC/DsvC family sulfur relay protein [Azohydromonas sediminis]|uniref:TusE/DsrC/DsvC family sulfur relay protein n=1 Tax=Azohydromonas sediminis TaxID=2259674 RepID=UPI000E65981B|nr:TusE/DsrC/DsvC family sulfur relay protein [Azohydromonas sediminis]
MAAPTTALPARDDEGYLVDPETWDDDVAAALAAQIGVVLEDGHGFVLRFMRDDYQEHRIAADARHVMRHLEQRYPGQGRKRLFELFPYGYVAQACKVAGMRRPRAWSTG